MLKVLLVDDEVGILQILDDLLSDAGYRTMTAGNGKQAIDVFQTERPDVVVLDWMMPIMDGPAAARALRAIDPGLPIILMSGADERAARERSSDFSVFVRKPFRGTAILDAVRTALAAASRPSAE